MKNVSAILPAESNASFERAGRALPVQAATIPENKQAAAKRWVDDTFTEVMASVSAGHMLARQPALEQATRKVWFLAFVEAGIWSKSQVRNGLANLRRQRREWMPSAHEFIELCQPSMQDYDMPEPEDAYAEAVKKISQRFYGEEVQWSHEAVRVAAGRTAMKLRTESESKSKPAFIREYTRAFELVKSGKLADDKHAITQERPDPNLLQYQRLLAQHGEEIANDFLSSCAEYGTVIQPEGAVTYEKPTRNDRESPARAILASLGVVDESKAVHASGDLPGYSLPDSIDVRKKREFAHRLLEAMEDGRD